jgi:shikimate kinase
MVIAGSLFGIGTIPWVHADESVRAVWNVQEIHLPYFGLTTQYSCDGLRDKMRELLKQLSVREDFVVSVGGCIEISGPTRNPSVRIVVANAVPATDEVAKAFATDPKRAELLARLQRKSKEPVSEAAFDAMPKRVTLYAKDTASAGASGDCELLEHLHRYVLPKLNAKVLKDNVSCTPHQGSAGNPSMEVALLVAVPSKT